MADKNQKKEIMNPGGSPELEIKVDTDVKDSRFIFTRTAKDSKKVLEYDYKRCNGCGICIDICPMRAMEPGPLVQIATGLDAPPVIIDHTKCSFCGMCAAFCPVRSVRMKTGEKDQFELPEYPHLKSSVKFNDKCIHCILCKKVCREDAVILELDFPKKETVAPFKEGRSGEIHIDMKKCTLCGLCGELCPAFVFVGREPTIDNPIPFLDLVIDKSKCDYCGICVGFCPEKAIDVKGEFFGITPQVRGRIRVDDEKCTRCGWCKAVCPYGAVEIEKPFGGEIELIGPNLKECDPVGCHGCFNVCPSNAWHIPRDKKIDVSRDLCTFCGACQKACHVFAIEVKRQSANHTEVKNTPWSADWTKAIGCLVCGDRKRPDISRTVKAEMASKNGVPPPDKIINTNLDKVRKQIEKMMPEIKTIKKRYKLEDAGISRKHVRQND